MRLRRSAIIDFADFNLFDVPDEVMARFEDTRESREEAGRVHGVWKEVYRGRETAWACSAKIRARSND